MPEITSKQAIHELRVYVTRRREAREAARHQADAGSVLRDYLEAHPGERLYDEGVRHEAYLQTRRTAGSYDVMSMSDGLILQAARLGILKVDNGVLDALDGKTIVALDVKKHATPGGETTALQVVKKEE